MTDYHTPRLEQIRDVAVQTGKPFKDVMEIYTRINTEEYSKISKLMQTYKIFSPSIEKIVLERTMEECSR